MLCVFHVHASVATGAKSSSETARKRIKLFLFNNDGSLEDRYKGRRHRDRSVPVRQSALVLTSDTGPFPTWRQGVMPPYRNSKPVVKEERLWGGLVS
jgi:hypothetical protein